MEANINNNLTRKEFAEAARLSLRSVGYLLSTGKIKAVRKGRLVFIPSFEAARINRNGVASIRPRKVVR